MDSPSFTSQIETGIQHMSESVFVGLCRTVGTSQQVTMWRDLIDITQTVTTVMYSGSYRERFRMKGSDVDGMFWVNNKQVIWMLLVNPGSKDD
ncbi:uncharacterized protein LOC130054801 isoform X2 [Ostrea edulis]|uniref:uncharacterized protein LOC130054801 isoform X2 n=1 Tax=Ostrea edulis TaxID=37623 RepID=UPI0024AEE902|nr:uncharacterized protein LOC130054801 isoform X2 [Ostrea edulis]